MNALALSTSSAFGITEEDVLAVLKQNVLRIADVSDKTVAFWAEEFFAMLGPDEHARVANAALASESGDIDDQTIAAHAEIALIMREQGLLK
ncbi:hypothetical protein [Acidihalobacter yilgarnensis]|nr:hypothetical protein [Acidihalobacter yilgarnensis]